MKFPVINDTGNTNSTMVKFLKRCNTANYCNYNLYFTKNDSVFMFMRGFGDFLREFHWVMREFYYFMREIKNVTRARSNYQSMYVRLEANSLNVACA